MQRDGDVSAVSLRCINKHLVVYLTTLLEHNLLFTHDRTINQCEQLAQSELATEIEVLRRKTLIQCRYVHDITWTGIEPRPPEWEAGEYTSILYSHMRNEMVIMVDNGEECRRKLPYVLNK
jgi:hypothetical protein